MSIITGPSMQFGLDLPYPTLGSIEFERQLVGIHRRSRAFQHLPATFSALAVIPLLFLVQLAVIVAGGVLIDTFVVRSLLVPWARRVVRKDDGGGEPAERPVPDCASVPAHPD
jgi:hypothetical protein